MKPTGDLDVISQVEQHVQRHVGPIEGVFHELRSHRLHIDVHWVAPSEHRPFHTLVTSGMSALPMNTGDERSRFRYAELSILLDPAWPLSRKALAKMNHSWPICVLKMLARTPLEEEKWLGYGHTVGPCEPGQSFSPSTDLSACIVLPSRTLGEGFWEMDRGDGASTFFLTLVPLYPSELRLALRVGSEAFAGILNRERISDVVRQRRPRIGERA